MSLNGAQRGEIIHRIATLLEEKIDTILDANQRDLAKANSSGKFPLFYNNIITTLKILPFESMNDRTVIMFSSYIIFKKIIDLIGIEYNSNR